MFVILFYDASEKRVAKFLRIARKYLHWVQRSVFEGELSEAQYKRMLDEFREVLNPEEDSLVIYTFRRRAYISREVHGQDMGSSSQLIL